MYKIRFKFRDKNYTLPTSGFGYSIIKIPDEPWVQKGPWVQINKWNRKGPINFTVIHKQLRRRKIAIPVAITV